MLITKARHEREMKALYAEIARTGVALTAACNDLVIAERQLRHTEAELTAASTRCDWLESDRDKLAARLKVFEDKRQRSNANLRRGNQPANGASARAVSNA